MHCGSKTLMFSLAAVLVCATGALGQAANPPVTNTFTAYVDNQATVNNCSPGEPVALNGTVVFSYQISTDSTGTNQYSVTATNSLTGIGQTTGSSYVAADSNDYASSTSDSSKDMTVELSSDLKSQGSTPSMTLVQTLHITMDIGGNISADILANTTSCGSAN
jgi:hypothetical protein